MQTTGTTNTRNVWSTLTGGTYLITGTIRVGEVTLRLGEPLLGIRRQEIIPQMYQHRPLRPPSSTASRFVGGGAASEGRAAPPLRGQGSAQAHAPGSTSRATTAR